MAFLISLIGAVTKPLLTGNGSAGLFADITCNSVSECDAWQAFAVIAIITSIASLAVAILAVGEWVPAVQGKKAAFIQAGASGATVVCMTITWALYMDYFANLDIYIPGSDIEIEIAVDGSSFILYLIGWVLYVALFVKTVCVCACA